PGMIDLQVFVSESHLLQRPGTHVLDEDVGVVEQCLQLIPAVYGLEVENDRFLVAIEPNERTRLPFDEWSRRPHGITARWFDLDDAGAHIGQLHRREWASDEHAEFEHCDP